MAILKNIERHKIDIEKGSYLVIILKLMSFVIAGGKEMNALQLMVLTYTETPNFGDAKQFEEELNIVTRKMEDLSKDLTSLNRELDLVESKMNLNSRHSLLAAPSRSLVSLDTSTLSGALILLATGHRIALLTLEGIKLGIVKIQMKFPRNVRLSKICLRLTPLILKRFVSTTLWNL